MKTNDKLLHLLNHGFSGHLLGELNESQVNTLYKKLVESKKENKEATTKTETKTYTDYSSGEVSTMKSKGQTINVKDGQVQPLPDGGIRVVQEEDDLENDDISLSLGAKGDDDMALALSNMEITEKFASKAQQKYFWAKGNRSKGKEKEKWCTMADEFQKSTSKKQSKVMPEKIHPEKTVKYKKETKENYLDMVGKAFNKNMGNKIADIRPSVNMGESEIEKGIMRLIEKHLTPKMSKKEFLSLVSEQGTKEKEKERTKEKEKERKHDNPYKPKEGPKTSPKAKKEETNEQGSPTIAPPKPKTPTKPSPSTPYRPKPGPKPAPKAGKENLPNWLSFKSIGINLK
jgi:hypothetical protein